MKILNVLVVLFIGFSFSASAQVNYDARTVNETFEGPFRPGVNLGYWPGWNQKELGDLVAGAGGRVVRPVLAEAVLDIWGYDLAVDDFEHWQSLGMGDFVATLGYPVDWHKDWTEYCPGTPSTMFANLYEPIWDDGSDGTPYNENNYFAAYVYKTVTIYTPYVSFWEIWNEPGFDETFNLGWRAPGDPVGNWWDNDPQPCDYILKAPIEHYIRTLRVAYEVIKTIAPEDKVMAGGFGFQSFLDAVLRNTDNPNGGAVTDDYPVGGGAYFEIFAMHNYSHFDGSTKDPGGAWHRHSDRAAQGLNYRKNFFQTIYDAYGYDGVTYPKKQHLATEMNVPRGFDEPNTYFASVDGQRNYLMKAFVTAHIENVIQFHIYSLADKPGRPFGFDKMGLWQAIDDVTPGNAVINVEGVTMRTTSDMLWETTYDHEHTAALNPPEGVAAHAFLREDGKYVYMLWAKTTIDLSEFAEGTYSFPADFGYNTLEKREWNYFQTQISTPISADSITLDATPIFLISDVVADFLQISCGNDIEVSADIGATGAVAAWDEPSVNSNCAQGTGQAIQVSGPQSGTFLDIGTYLVEYEVSNDCGQTKTCSFTVNVMPPNTDCFSEGIAPWNEWIAGVQMSNVFKESGKCDPGCGYADYTDLIVEAVLGETYDLTLTPGLSYPNYPADLYWSVWIDLNEDGYFHPEQELIAEAYGGNQVLNIPITVSPVWPVGIKGMRISASKAEFADPCNDVAFGEVEDYSIDITEGGLSCSMLATALVSGCNDNGTIYDPNDDVYTITLNVVDPGQGENFIVESERGLWTFSYGQPALIGPIKVETGIMNLTITDENNENCFTEINNLVIPELCSDGAWPACGDNKLLNSGFDGSGNWTYWFDAFTSNQQVGGERGVVILPNNNRIYQWVNAVPGATYEMNTFAKMSGGGGNGKVGIRFLNSSWQEISAHYVDVSSLAYEPIATLVAVAPMNASLVEVTAINLDMSKKLYVDEFCLSQLPGAPEYDRGTKGTPLVLDARTNAKLFGKQIQVYPNPARDYINIDFGLIHTKNAKIKVFDSRGTLVHLQQVEEQAAVQLSNLNWSSGIYFVELEAENGERYVERVVLQR